MKKILLVAAIALFGLTANAQDYKAKAGDVTVDLSVAGGLGNTTVNLADQGFGNGAMIRGRYFKTEKLAYRGLVFLAAGSSTDKSVTNTETKSSNTGIGLGFGVEKHFTGTDRLATYVGFDGILAFNSTKDETTLTAGGTTFTTEVKGPNDFRIGVRGVFGADYYFVKRAYIGVEAGLGLYYKSVGKETTSSTGLPDAEVDGSSSFNISPSIVTGFRLGYAF